jgi:recombination protein RecT
MSNALATINHVRELFQKSKAEIEAALPKHLTADRMLRIAMTEIRQNPKLLECDPKSLLGAVIQASQLGLEPGSALGHCYLIPFFNSKAKVFEVQFMPGYRGFLDLARRSGTVTHIVARVVYDCDEFDVSYGLDEQIIHKPNFEADKGDIVAVYAVAFLRDGGKQFDVMTIDEIEAIRKRSKASDFGPWKTDFEAMAKKTVIRRLFKYLPVSVEIQKAVGMDELAEVGESQGNAAVIEIEPAAKSSVWSEVLDEKPAQQSGRYHVKVARSRDDVQKSKDVEERTPAQADIEKAILN